MLKNPLQNAERWQGDNSPIRWDIGVPIGHKTQVSEKVVSAAWVTKESIYKGYLHLGVAFFISYFWSARGTDSDWVYASGILICELFLRSSQGSGKNENSGSVGK